MRHIFSFPFFLFILLSSFTLTGNAYALTPVADLTGEWSGFAQVSYDGTPCAVSGKVNGFFEQDGNDLHGEFSFVPTTTDDTCSYEPWDLVVDGTIDGSRVTLFDHSGINFSGWYASSGIKLDFAADWGHGTTQLSPTGFSPPAYQQDEPAPQCRADQELVDNQCLCPEGEEEINGVCQIPEEPDSDGDTFPDSVDTCPNDPEDSVGIDDGCPEDDQGDEFAEEEDAAEPDDSLNDVENESESQDWAEDEVTPEETKLDDIRDKILGIAELGKLDEALVLLDKMLENDPNSIFALYNKGVVLGKLDRNIEALSYIDKLLEVDPNDSDAQEVQNILTEKIKTGSKISVTNEIPIAEIKSYFTAGGERGEICNYILNKANPCTNGISGELKPGDLIMTGENNFAVIKLDGGQSTIYLGPKSKLGVLQVNEKLRLFYVPETNISLKAEIHDKPGVTTKFGMCANDDEECVVDKIKFWAWIGGTELLIERHLGEDTKLTVLEGHVGVLKGSELTPTVIIDTNNQLILQNDISLDTKTVSVNPESIDRWWDDALALEQAQQSSTGSATPEKGGGCLIATAAFGSEMAPQVQWLREVRDGVLFGTSSGTSFMAGFNQFYYLFSPTIADWERQNPAFKEIVKMTITPMLSTLSILNYVDIDSEQDLLAYGIGIILLNIGMYFVLPALVILKLKDRSKKNQI